jgi:hypothetical protein
LNITSSKSFKIEGDILKRGDTFLKTIINCYFIIVNGTRGESLCLLDVEIEFVSGMNSTVFILRGK